MGRWRSSLVIRYSCDKGAHGITHDTIRGLAANNVNVTCALAPVGKAMFPEELDKAADALFKHEVAARKALASKPAYVLNKMSWVLHRCLPDGVDRYQHKTLCGAS